MHQEQIASSPCHQMHACKHELCNHCCVAILPVEADQSRLCCESEMRQVGGNGAESRGKFTAIIPIPLAPIGADPLARVHLESSRAGAYHFPSFAPCVAWCTDRLESASCSRQGRITGQSSLSCCLACGIHIKDDGATTLSIEDSTNGRFRPPVGKALLKKRTEGF